MPKYAKKPYLIISKLEALKPSTNEKDNSSYSFSYSAWLQ